MDDAFAGGVCRCLHCGTIQTVPANLKGSAVGAQSAKSLYQVKTRTGGGGTGLEDLAEAVSSSGLRDHVASARRNPSASSEAAGASPTMAALTKSPALMILVGAGGAVIVGLLILVLVLLMRSPKPGESGDASGASAAVGGSAKTVMPPGFCGIRLDGSSVIYILDRGDSSRPALGAMKSATLKSLESLGPERKFQVMFWANNTEFMHPASMAPATPAAVLATRDAIDDVFASGATDIRKPLEKAVAQNPSEIVIVTGKGWNLDETFTSLVMRTRGSSGIKIHAVSVGNSPASPALEKVAKQTGGEYREMSVRDMQGYGQGNP